MSALAPTLEAFFTERLIRQKKASPNTIAAYRDTLRLLLCFTTERLGKQPSELDLGELDAPLIGEFLDHLERERGNSARTRNTRLAAIRSLFRFAGLRHPEHAAAIGRVLAIPSKRLQRNLVTFLNEEEVAALLAAPDPATPTGRRDRAMLALAVQTGLRASELIGLQRRDVHLGTGPHVRCMGKGRKERITPLTSETVAVLALWLAEHAGEDGDPLFPSRHGGQLSRDALESRIALHVATATLSCPSLAAKNVTAHSLRHTLAMRLLQAEVDTSTIALWLGHEHPRTTQVYLHADLGIKERALARTTPPDVKAGRYQPPDSVLAFLEGL